jgi:sec-independent protein translocase protein TatC
MSFAKHFVELKWRTFYLFIGMFTAFATCYFFSSELLYVLTSPLMEQSDLTASIGSKERYLIFTNITEAFTTHLLLSVYVTMLLIFPFILLQVWLFLAPGLYPKEEKKLRYLFLLSPLCFIIGCLATYFLILPVAWKFFLGFEATGSHDIVNIHLEAKISEYLDLSARLFFVVGLLFQYPIVLLILIHLKVLTKEWMVSKRKFFCLMSFVVAALFSPPDIFSQVMIAIPLLFFYETAIFFLVLKQSYKILSLVTVS